MQKFLGVLGAACSVAALAVLEAAPAAAGVNTATTSIPTPNGTVEMHVTANCTGGDGRCFFNTQANLLTPDGPIGLPGDAWARQTVTIRSTDRNVYQNAWYSAPAGMPRELKGANHDNVLSKAYKSITDYQISVTYFGGGPMERFAVDGDSVQTDWQSGQPNLKAGFIACSDIQVVFGGVNVSTPTACAQTTFN